MKRFNLILMFTTAILLITNYANAFSRLFVITNNSRTSTISIQRIRPVTIGHDQYGNFWCNDTKIQKIQLYNQVKVYSVN